LKTAIVLTVPMNKGYEEATATAKDTITNPFHYYCILSTLTPVSSYIRKLSCQRGFGAVQPL
jgi:hypothetical protein